MVTITKNNFNLHRINEESIKNFVECDLYEMSDFHQAALKWIGDALRQKESQHFWRNGAYCWYTDGKQDHKQCVWMTLNGIAMFEDITEGGLYRIEFA